MDRDSTDVPGAARRTRRSLGTRLIRTSRQHPAAQEVSTADPGNPPADSEAQEASLADLMQAPAVTPFTARPEVVNERDVMRALEREYPPIVRDAGIGGTILVHFFIDTEGVVQRVLVAESSGHEALDEAALRVARVFRFNPARDEDGPVPVWIAIPVVFQTREEFAGGWSESPANPDTQEDPVDPESAAGARGDGPPAATDCQALDGASGSGGTNQNAASP